MKISSISPLGLQNHKGNTKISMPAFRQETMSDSEKLTKALEALSDIGSALKRIGEKTKETAAALRGTKNVPVVQGTTETDDIKSKVVSKVPEINTLIRHIKSEYRTGQRILESSATTDYSNYSNSFDNPYPKRGDYDEDFYIGPDTTQNKDTEERAGVHYKVHKGNYTVYNNLNNTTTFEMEKNLPEGIKESYTYNDSNNFYYRKYNASTNETLAYLNLNGNILKYYDENKEPEGLTLKINPNEKSVIYYNGNNCVYTAADDKNKVFLDSRMINLLIGRY